MKKTVRKFLYGLTSLALTFYFVIPGTLPIAQAVAETQYVGHQFLTGGDDEYTADPVDIGFTFDFYGNPETQVYVNTNGVLMFDNPDSDYNYEAIPTAIYGKAIMAFWSDLTTENEEAPTIYYDTVGEPGDQAFIVQWTNMSFCCDTGFPFGTFQVILFEATGEIRIQYRDLYDDPYAHGAGSTIGIQYDSVTGDQFSFDTESVTAGDSLSFMPDGDGGYDFANDPAGYYHVYLYMEDMPEAVTLTDPADTLEGVSVNPVFQWDGVDSADGYILAISDSIVPGDGDSVYSYETTDTFYDTVAEDSLNLETTYYWRVISVNANGYSYSDIFSFTTEEGPNIAPVVWNLGPEDLLSGGTVDPTMLMNIPFTFGITDENRHDQVGYDFLIYDGEDNTVMEYVSPLGEQGDQAYYYGQAGTYVVGAPDMQFEDGITYYVAVMAFDEHDITSDWNPWWTEQLAAFDFSATASDDRDGVEATIEDDGPNDGDANDDGFLDSWQSNVTSLPDAVTNNTAVLESTGECRENLTVTVDPESTSAPDAGYAYPAGLLNFSINCQFEGATATITQYFYGVTGTDFVARKYNAETGTYTTIPDAVISSVTIDGQTVLKVQYQITDGSELDADGEANGVIVDPSGPARLLAAVTTVVAPNTGLKPITVQYFVASIVVGAALIVLQKQRRLN